MEKLGVFCLVIIYGLAGCTQQKEMTFSSPGGELRLEWEVKDGISGFSYLNKSDTVLLFSPVGLDVNGEDLSRGAVIRDLSVRNFDNTWQTVNGKNHEIRNHYNEYDISCRSAENLDFHIVVRCYDDGFAYRFVIPEQEGFDSIAIRRETTHLNFKEDFTYWAYNNENHNLGPVQRDARKLKQVKTPVVLRTTSGHWMAIHEAAIFRYAPFTLNASSDGYTFGLNFGSTKDELPVQTSWRTFISGDKPGDLPESNLLVNLNEPCKIDDTSWIKPGKSLWDWRVWGYEAPDGFKYGLNTVSHKRMIDFASEHTIQYLLIDADWYGPEFSESADPTNAREGVDIEECMAYARGKGIGVILYLNDVGAKKFGLERVLKQFHDWGAQGVKYGFMRSETMEEKVRHTRKVVELCAKYQLMVDFHDSPIAPSGDRRTWPNLVTKEFGHGQADAKKSCWPETFVNQVFINQIAGPLDFCNGWFDLEEAKASRVKVFEEIPSTLAAEVAKIIALYTGWIVLPDAPEAYLEHKAMFECIRRLPPQFDSYEVLDGTLDEFAIVLRKAGNDWFVGAVTNRESRTATIDFSFLPEGEKFVATFYEDAMDAHFLNNKEAYGIRKMEISSSDKVEVSMAPGGGNAIWVTPDED